jgi:hypothetical protein
MYCETDGRWARAKLSIWPLDLAEAKSEGADLESFQMGFWMVDEGRGSDELFEMG